MTAVSRTLAVCPRSDGPRRLLVAQHLENRGITTGLTYTLERFDADRVVLVGRNDTATSTETIEAAADSTGSRVTYTNELRFNGFAKLAAPLGKAVFEKLGNDTERQLADALNRLDR